ncbi:MAG: YciI family protein [Methyloceanibacter sp.]|uniref:YciI family protein n=1 Tax=Methyloceanibacter sp. TaxID=1965321 RepID=UPI001E01ED79|nr:YciI family protein [Methyloceanibacter sp.]MCB1443852.1 YciI family protein [Methyloceanibacter sp.]
MLFAFICTDKPDGLPVRMAHRPEHLAYLKGLGRALKFAGPFTAEDGETMNGSLVVIEADSLATAREIASADPFAKAGLFASVEIRPWLWSLGKPEEKA